MSRLFLTLVVALLVSACTSAGEPHGDDGSSRVDARAIKAEMDAEARSLLPDLLAQVGGTLTGMRATFYERGGHGLWDYTAGGSIERPPGTVAEALGSATAALEEHGFTVESEDAQKRVTGRKENVSVIVEAALLTDDRSVSRLNVSMGNIDAITEGDHYAGSTPPEDYTAQLR